MRLKNVRNASEIINSSSYVIKEPQNYREKWNKLFNNDNPIDIEIGMGKGDFIIEMAKRHPNINYIGIEMFDSVIVRAVQKLEGETIDNEINTIYLNFSDPWPKNRHEKRRLTSSYFLKKYDDIFKGEKKIFQKTDNIGLFAYSVESLSCYGYTLKNVTMDLKDLEDNVMTEYEKKFVSKNVKICRLEAYKK